MMDCAALGGWLLAMALMTSAAMGEPVETLPEPAAIAAVVPAPLCRDPVYNGAAPRAESLHWL